MYELTALYYDKYGRIVQTHSSNHLGGYDISYSALDFTGKPIKTYKTHGINGAYDTYKENYVYTYDKAQRLLTTTHQLNGGSTIILVSNTYDELGRLQTKKVGNNIDTTSYAYNIRNWTTDIIGSKFTENLYYTANTASLPTFTPCYNGNIAGMQWNISSESLGYNRAYTFGYDGLNRLTDANYCGFSGSAVAGTAGKYDEHFGFDKMGNFNALTRNENGTPINNLIFSYTGNQMVRVDNSVSPAPFIAYGSEAFKDTIQSANEYNYDKNGSTTYDANSGISTIQYNLLNLPDIIQFTQGHKNLYTYDAGGRKLEAVTYTVNNKMTVPIGSISTLPTNPTDYTKLTTDYVGNMIYENGVLKEILLPEGYYQGGVYYYYLKDHLGDTRVVINSSGAVMEKSHYYPSGMRFFPESTSNSAALPYRYNGKELEAMNGLNQYDYGARRRGAGLPIWTAVDPHAEKYYSISPYVYCMGNPVRFIDPKGMDPVLDEKLKKNHRYGVMVILPNSYKNDKAMVSNYEAAKKKGIPIMLVDNMKDLKTGMEQLKDKGVSVNAYSINQHGNSGITSIGDEKINANTDFSSLKEGLSGKNVFLHSCDVTKGENDFGGIDLVSNFSKQTNSNVVSSDHLMTAGKFTGESLNGNHGIFLINQYAFGEGPTSNDFHIAQPNQAAKSIYDFTIRDNGTFLWNVNDNDK